MSGPTPISQHKPSNSGGDLTQKDELENIALVITSAKPVKGGKFWIVEAVRQDTGEAVVFSGSKVVDDVMAHVTAQNAFPVSAVLVKVKADNPQGWYWDLQDPPNAIGNGAPAAPSRIDQVQEIIAYRRLTDADVVAKVTEIGGEGAKVRDLDDAKFQQLLDALMSMGDAPSDAPLEEPPF